MRNYFTLIKPHNLCDCPDTDTDSSVNTRVCEINCVINVSQFRVRNGEMDGRFKDGS